MRVRCVIGSALAVSLLVALHAMLKFSFLSHDHNPRQPQPLTADNGRRLLELLQNKDIQSNVGTSSVGLSHPTAQKNEIEALICDDKVFAEDQIPVIGSEPLKIVKSPDRLDTTKTKRPNTIDGVDELQNALEIAKGPVVARFPKRMEDQIVQLMQQIFTASNSVKNRKKYDPFASVGALNHTGGLPTLDDCLSTTRLREIEHICEVKHFHVYKASDLNNNNNRLVLPRNTYTRGLRQVMEKYFATPFDSRSGMYWYPPGGFCGWHTNGNVRGVRLYVTWTSEGNKSFFRYRDPVTNETITDWDLEGLSIRMFPVDNDEHPLWHSVGSFTNRFSVGFNLIQIERLVDQELLAFLEPTKSIKHHTGTLYEHLIALARHLHSTSKPEYVVRAGLFHSVYPGGDHEHSLTEDRTQLSNLIGKKAEELVYRFNQFGSNLSARHMIKQEENQQWKRDLISLFKANRVCKGIRCWNGCHNTKAKDISWGSSL